MKKRWLSLLLVGVMAFSMIGCGVTEDSASKDDSANTETGEDESGEAAEKVFRYAMLTEPTSLDPDLGYAADDITIQHGITEGLVRNTAGEITPGIAESWEVSDDGLTYTFHLREACWSDGEPITAGDYEYGWKRLMNPETGSLYAYVGSYLLNGDAVVNGEKDVSELGVTALDDSTLEVKLERPTSYFLSCLGLHSCFAPVRQDIVEQYGTDFAATADKNVYSGPYVLASSENQMYILEKNENYWDKDSINLDRVEISIVENKDTMFSMYEAGDLDYTTVPTAYVESYKDQISGSYIDGNIYFLFLNTDNQYLANQNMRLALNYAINRNDYIALATDNVHAPFCRMTSPELSGVDGKYGDEYSINAYPEEGDEEKAKEYLTAAMNELGVSDPSEISLAITTLDSEGAKKMCEVVQEMWKQVLGIKVTINQVTYSELWSNTLPDCDYEVSYGGWTADYDDPYTFLDLLKGDGLYHYTPYANAEADELLNKALMEPDAKTRMEELNQAEQILIDDGAMIPLQMNQAHYMVNEKVTGLKFYNVTISLDWVYADIEE